MKKNFICTCVSILLCVSAFAQSDSIMAGWGQLDYSIPESPAFSLLSDNPDNMLTPSSATPFTIGMTDFRNFGAEISPLLFVPKLTLEEFKKKPRFYTSRLSIGTNTKENGVLQLSSGLRFSIIDHTDLRLDKKFNDELADILFSDETYKIKAIEEIMKRDNLSYFDCLENYGEPTELGKRIAEVEKELRGKDIKTVENLREERKKELWNASIWEVGVAGMMEFPDNYIQNSNLAKIGIWTTAGLPMGKKGQILVGARYEMCDSVNVILHNFSIGTRAYYGTNELRGFAQAQCEYDNLNKFIPTLSAGVEYKLYNGLWARVSANAIVEKDGKIQFVPKVNLFFGSREKGK